MADEKSLAAQIRRELDDIKKHLTEGIEADDLEVLRDKAQSSAEILDELSAYCGEIVGPDRRMQMSLNIYLKDVIPTWKKKFWAIDIQGTSEGSVEINCSKLKLKKAIENLILNSMEAGATKVEINVKKDGLAVVDDGDGISPEDSEKIKAEGTTKGKGRGHGLKLVREFLATMGWTLELGNNKEGEGLTVLMKKGAA